MNYQDLTSKLWSENILFSVLLELTYNCNLNCFFCYNDRDIQGKPLSKEQYFALLKELQEMQVLNIVLSGGEPLAHPDFLAIGGKARELGFVVRIKSNGHGLHKEMLGRIKTEIDPFIIDISLHGATAETHDRQTQVAGSFDRLVSNINLMRDMDMRFRVNGTLSAWNEHEIEEMFALANEWGVAFILNPQITPRDNGDLSPLSIVASDKAIQQGTVIAGIYNKPQSVEHDGKNRVQDTTTTQVSKQCGTGSSTLTIDPVGSILPCVQWRRPVGNLHETGIKAIWQNSTDLDDIRKTATDAKIFVDDLDQETRQMGYCIGQAVVNTGSPVQTYSVPLSQLLK